MLKVRVGAQETYRSSIRPTIMASIKQVMENLNLNRNVLTFFNGESEVSRMIGTDFTSKIRTDQQTDVGFQDRQFITFESDLAGANDELDSKHKYPTNTPFWQDNITGAMIIPMFVCRKYTLTVNRYFKDRVTANQFRDRIQNTLVNGFVNVFSPIVHYPISYQMMECYESIYTRLVNAGIIDGTKITALQWFTANCKAPWDIITDIAGGNPCFVFKRRIDTLSLLFNGVNITTSSKGRYKGQHLVSFEYSFYYPDHTFFELHYPIMVYQQLTEEQYIPKVPEIMLNDYAGGQFYESAMSVGMGQYLERKTPFMFAFPKEDNFRPEHIYNLELVLQRMAAMENKENQTVLNLFTFSDVESFWEPKVEQFIKKYHRFITIRHKSPFHLKVYSDDVPVLDKHVILTETGDIILKHKPTMSAIYRVCFYLDRAIWDYDQDAWDSIRWDCEFGKWVFDKLFPWMPIPTSRPCPVNPNDPWIDQNEIEPHIPYDPAQKDWTKIYMLDALLIAKNERFPDENNRRNHLYLRERD